MIFRYLDNKLNPDVNPFQRTFVRDIRRYDEMERKLRFLESQITKNHIIIAGRLDRGDYSIMPTAELNQLETTLADLERDVSNMNESDSQLMMNYMELKEWDAVLDKTDEFLQGGIDDQAAEELETQEEEYGKVEKAPISYSVGVIRRERLPAFERVLWRACHHAAYIRSSPIEEDIEDENASVRWFQSESHEELPDYVQDKEYAVYKPFRLEEFIIEEHC